MTRPSLPSLSRSFGPEFAAVSLVCATACPGDGDGVTGPGTTSAASNAATDSTPPTTSQGDPTSATGPTTADPTSATDPTMTTVGSEATDTNTDTVATVGVDPDTTTIETAGTNSEASETATSRGDTGTTATDSGDTDTTATDSGDSGDWESPPPGSVDCPALEFDEPIVIDDFSRTFYNARELPGIAIAWRADGMVIARANRRPNNEAGCDIWWDHRDDDGQKIGETVVIPVAATENDMSDGCKMIGDIAWDAAHQRYIFIHPQAGQGAQVRSLPLAITPAGELAWTASGETRVGIYEHGVKSQLRIVGDELFVLGLNFPQTDQARPAVHVYSTVDGTWLRTVMPPLYGLPESTIMCDATCTQGIILHNSKGLWPIDMSTGALIGDPKSLGSYGMLSSPMLDWRPDDSFYIGRVMYYGAKDQKFETVTATLDSSYDIKGSIALPTYGFNSWYDWYEASWAATDDGYVLVATRFPWHSALNTEDSRDMRVQVWNVGLDGKIHESTLLPDLRAHTPRIAIKEGRVAITYAHMLEPYESLDSRRLVFASCPP